MNLISSFFALPTVEVYNPAHPPQNVKPAAYGARESSTGATIATRSIVTSAFQMAKEKLITGPYSKMVLAAFIKASWDQSTIMNSENCNEMLQNCEPILEYNYSKIAVGCVSAVALTSILYMHQKLESLYEPAIAALKDSSRDNLAVIFSGSSFVDPLGVQNIWEEEITYMQQQMGKVYSIEYGKGTSVSSINACIEEKNDLGTPINLIVFDMHGDPYSMGCSVWQTLTASDKTAPWLGYRDIAEINFEQLAPNATILLRSCSTGKTPENGDPNIAEWTQVYAGINRQVAAPSEDLKMGVECMDDQGKFHFIDDGIEITAKITYESALQKIETYLSKQLNTPDLSSKRRAHLEAIQARIAKKIPLPRP